MQFERKGGETRYCPSAGHQLSSHDSRRRRYLDICQYTTILAAHVPRVKCLEQGVVITTASWAEPDWGFTALFAALAIDWRIASTHGSSRSSDGAVLECDQWCHAASKSRGGRRRSCSQGVACQSIAGVTRGD